MTDFCIKHFRCSYFLAKVKFTLLHRVNHKHKSTILKIKKGLSLEIINHPILKSIYRKKKTA